MAVHGLELPLYDSLAAMAAQTGIPVDILKSAKREGCVFVRHGRCDLRIFLEWFFSRTGDNQDWTKRSKRAEALTREHNLQTLQKESIPFAEVTYFLQPLVSVVFFGELDRLLSELPASVKGASEVQIHSEVGKQIEQIKTSLTVKLDEWQKKGKQ